MIGQSREGQMMSVPPVEKTVTLLPNQIRSSPLAICVSLKDALQRKLSSKREKHANDPSCHSGGFSGGIGRDSILSSFLRGRGIEGSLRRLSS